MGSASLPLYSLGLQPISMLPLTSSNFYLQVAMVDGTFAPPVRFSIIFNCV